MGDVFPNSAPCLPVLFNNTSLSSHQIFQKSAPHTPYPTDLHQHTKIYNTYIKKR